MFKVQFFGTGVMLKVAVILFTLQLFSEQCRDPCSPHSVWSEPDG